MDDPYVVLGVGRSATPDEIRTAYRHLAKELHPDLHPGDKAAEEKFKRVTSAYDLLSDKDKRRQFDTGEIDAAGRDRPERTFYRSYANRGQGAEYASFDLEDDELADLFSGLFQHGRDGTRVKVKGADVAVTLSIGFVDAAKGATRRLTTPDGRALDVKIPAGATDGQTLRLKGQGMPGIGGGPAGDAFVKIRVDTHPVFRRDGRSVHCDLPISLSEAVLGGKVKVPTIDGDIMMTVPAGSNTGSTLRLKGKGIGGHTGPRGDQLVHLRVHLPDKPDTELTGFVKTWTQSHAYDPRRP